MLAPQTHQRSWHPPSQRKKEILKINNHLQPQREQKSRQGQEISTGILENGKQWEDILTDTAEQTTVKGQRIATASS